MSEGGRKVWNRQQLLALNEGAVVLARSSWQRWDGQKEPMEYRPNCGEPFLFHVFGDEDHFDVVDEYPMEVIWEPSNP